MPRPNLRIAPYRAFEENRIRVNDALVSQRAAIGLAQHLLASQADQDLLPKAFPSIPGLSRLNRTIEDSRVILASSESDWARMALPYVLSVHEAFVSELVQFLRDQDLDDALHRDYKPRVNDIKLVDLHRYVARCAVQPGKHAGVLEWDLFNWLRVLRNTIVHRAGKDTGSEVRSTYDSLSPAAKIRWETVAGRSFGVDAEDQVVVASREVYGALAVSDRLAQQMIRLIAAAPIDEAAWAHLIVADYASRHPGKWPLAARKPEKLEVYARTEFRLASTTAGALASAVAMAR